MSRLHTSGKDTDPKVPYQKPDHGFRVIPAKGSARAAEFARRYFEKNPLVFRTLSGRYTHTDGSPCNCYPEGNVMAELGKKSVLGRK